MPTIARSDVVPANSRSLNVLAGEQFEFIPFLAAIAVRAAASVTGLNADFNVGGTQVVQNGLVSDANRYPIDPDDRLTEFGGDPGDRLFLSYLNTTGAAITVRTVIDIDALG